MRGLFIRVFIYLVVRCRCCCCIYARVCVSVVVACFFIIECDDVGVRFVLA